MSEDLKEEVEAIRSIYGEETFRKVDTRIYVLSIPPSPAIQSKTSLRISFPVDYPASSPQVLGTETTGVFLKKGHGKRVVDAARATLEKVFNPGCVCVFDLLQELETSCFQELKEDQESLLSTDPEQIPEPAPEKPLPLPPALEEEPKWITSTPVTEKKSTFVARACLVKSPSQVAACIAHLLDTDKRAVKATHNITAYRIRSSATANSTDKITYQDCDDDGESAAGGRLLHLLQLMDVWDVLVVVSRWYGGVKLGPDRFSIINNVAREAVVKGGWMRSRS